MSFRKKKEEENKKGTDQPRRKSVPINTLVKKVSTGNSMSTSVPNDPVSGFSVNMNNNNASSSNLLSFFTSSQKNENDFPKKLPEEGFEQEEIVCYTNKLQLTNELFHHLPHVKSLRLTKDPWLTKDSGLKTIPEDIELLHKLETLVLTGNSFENFPKAICKLKQLKVLQIDNCKITGNISNDINKLQAVERLILDSNKIEQPVFTNLNNIKYFSMLGNGLNTFPVLSSNNLTYLNVSNNFLTDLPDGIFQTCKQLERLYLNENGLKKVPSSIHNLEKLKLLNISQNMLTELPKSIGKLKSLQYCNVTVNDITLLPRSLVKLKQNKSELTFLCVDNPLIEPPIDIAVKGLNAIDIYFKALDNGNVHNKRVKLMVLGEKDAGKTSLANAVQGKGCDPYVKEDTIGIDFYEWLPEENDVEILIVDCAGEHKYTLTHQLFVSIGMVFVIVVNLAEYEMGEVYFQNKVGYWLSVIISRLPSAVIMIVPTHLDAFHDNKELMKEKCKHIIISAEKHANSRRDIFLEKRSESMNQKCSSVKINPFLPNAFKYGIEDELLVENVINNDKPKVHLIPVSNKTLEGTDLLRKEIFAIIDNKKLCPHVNRNIPESWLQLENYCGQLVRERPRCPVIELNELWNNFGKIKDIEVMKEALEHIDCMGPICYFHSMDKMKDVIFLEPKWLLTLLKKVFDQDITSTCKYKPLFLNKFGMFEGDFKQDLRMLNDASQLSISLLRCLWVDFIDNNQLFEQLVGLFIKFELFCELDIDLKRTLLVPWYFKDKEPECNNDNQKHIMIHIETGGVLPDGFFHRYIIRVHALLTDIKPWMYGFTGFTKQDGLITCKNENGEFCSTIKIVASANKQAIYNQWKAILEIVKIFEGLITEWKGISYKLFARCPSCYENNKDKAKKDEPYTWTLDLKNLCRERDTHYRCMFDCMAVIDPLLLFPPFGILYECVEEDERVTIETKPLHCKITEEEYDKISYNTCIHEHYKQLCRKLKVNDSLLSLNNQNKGEIVRNILSEWQMSFPGPVPPSRKDLIDILKDMKPYPNAAIDCLYFLPT